MRGRGCGRGRALVVSRASSHGGVWPSGVTPERSAQAPGLRRRLRWRASCSVDSTPFPVATSTWVFWLTLALGVVVAMRIERSPQHGTL